MNQHSAPLPAEPAHEPITREHALATFKTLVARYGLQWTAAVPAIAYQQLARCNTVLTTRDRREALGLRN
ncbi:hypothetical protein [Hydrogenophaga sp. PML113]|uniref:hypothetical protein n=1 Tax=Hydrogenophaga sp. PML113 TaxID=1899350 RepID=UPI000878317B|nr:hypothetical protein [Hydrogenophaga sp. PML113]